MLPFDASPASSVLPHLDDPGTAERRRSLERWRLGAYVHQSHSTSGGVEVQHPSFGDLRHHLEWVTAVGSSQGHTVVGEVTSHHEWHRISPWGGEQLPTLD